MTDTHLLTISEARAALKVSRSTIYRMRAGGHLRIVKVLSLSRVPKSDIDRIANAYQPPVGELVGEPPRPKVKKIQLIPKVSGI